MRVFIIILNWNGWKDTIECVQSCLKLTCPDFRIVLVDNGSSDGSERILRERFPELDFIQTGSNLGFAGGNNVGIRYALERGADLLWLLNNDTIVHPEALAELVDVATSHPEAGIVGSKIYYFEEPNKIWFAGGFWRSSKSFATHRGGEEEDVGQYSDICEVDFITGCSLLIRASVVRQIGEMKEDYFLYWEEVDWNASAAEAGWKILLAPASLVWHKISASLKGQTYLQIRYFIRNCLLFFQRHSPRRLPRLFMYIVYDGICFWRKGEHGKAKGYLDGVIDFLFRRFGKIEGKARPAGS